MGQIDYSKAKQKKPTYPKTLLIGNGKNIRKIVFKTKADYDQWKGRGKSAINKPKKKKNLESRTAKTESGSVASLMNKAKAHMSAEGRRNLKRKSVVEPKETKRVTKETKKTVRAITGTQSELIVKYGLSAAEAAKMIEENWSNADVRAYIRRRDKEKK